MRLVQTGIFLAIILLASGCLESRLSPVEAQWCLLSTNVQPSVIPICKNMQDCEEKLLEFFPNKTFQNISVGTDSIRARKGLAGAWSKTLQASETLERIHQSCTTLQAAAILPLAVASAGELQNALAFSEEAQSFTFLALEKTIVEGAELELERVKDAGAFESYANLLQKAHDVQTQNPSSDWARVQVENQNYFENISRVIGQNKAGNYGVEWNSVLGVYKTGVSILAPERARIITAVSPMWQGALSAFLGKSKGSNALSIVTEIQANEVIEHVEQVVSPQNGIVVGVWKELAAFDVEVSALKESEIELEASLEQKWEGASLKVEGESEENEKWERTGKTLRGWLEVWGEKSPLEGERENVPLMVEELAAQMRALKDARVLQTKSLGKRMEEWRVIEKKWGDLEAKRAENEQINGAWKSVCEKVLQQNEKTKDKMILNADDCQNNLDALLAVQEDWNDLVKLTEKNNLESCVEELNEVEKALGEEFTLTEYFNYYFDEGSVDACESAVINAQQRYENKPIVKEWNEKWEKIEAYAGALAYALHTLDWAGKNSTQQTWTKAQKFLMEKKAFFTSNAFVEKMSEADELVRVMETRMDEIVNEAAKRIKWKIIQPLVVRADEEENLEWRGEIFPYWGESLEHAFVAGVSNPGLQTNARANENIQMTVEEDEIILDGEALPEKGIWIEGSGRGVAARIRWENVAAEMIGKNARVTQEGSITTDFAPAMVEWGVTLPPGTKKESLSIEMNGKKEGVERPGNGERVQAMVLEKNNSIVYHFTVENAMGVETTIISQTNEWGRGYTQYHVAAENRLSQQINASIYTGINGDPLLVESVVMTNENGEKVNTSRGADGAIVVVNQTILPNQTRKYSVLVEMIEGIEEWMSLLERMLAEVEALMQNENTIIASEAGKIRTKLLALRRETNMLEIAQKMIPIQNEISALRTKAEEEKNNWASLENRWREAASNALEKNDEWIVRGNAALQNKNTPQLEEAILKLVEKNALKTIETPPTKALEITKINEIKSIIETAEKGLSAYEKGINVGCEKLLLINFPCPLTEEMVRSFKNKVAAHKKVVDKLEAKLLKLSAEKQAEEWSRVKGEWDEMSVELREINNVLVESSRVLRNATVERVAKLKLETRENTDEEILSAVEKADSSVANGEFGKGIFIAQNMLNYISGNKATGLVSIPMVAWPLLGVIVLVGTWMGVKEWKKKKVVEIPLQTIPKGNIRMSLDEKQMNAFVLPPTRGEHPLIDKEGAERQNPSQQQMLGRRRGGIPHPGLFPQTRQKKEGPHSRAMEPPSAE